MGSNIYPSNDRVQNAAQTSAPTNPRIGDLWVDTGTPLQLVALGGGRNILHNGAFNVWQRGTSTKFMNAVDYSADRWSVGWYQQSNHVRQDVSGSGAVPYDVNTVYVCYPGTYGALNGVSSTVPFTWKANDQVFISGTYEAA